jgi:hypothetical protein
MSRQTLHAAIVNLLREHIGIAAEFVVDDAFADLDGHKDWVAHPLLMQSQFLIILERHAPKEVPFGRLRAEIISAIEKHGISNRPT